MDTKIKRIKRARRQRRIRAKISGTGLVPRLSVFKSNRYVSAQIIDDTKGFTLAASNSKGMNGKTGLEKAKMTGLDLAKKALEKNVKKVVFDRGGYIYTGVVAALAEGAREGGLVF